MAKKNETQAAAATSSEPVVVVITEAMVAEMILVALKTQAEAFNEAMSKNMAEMEKFCREEFTSVEQVKDLFNEAFSGMIETGGLQPLATAPEMPAAELNPDWLEGLTFNGVKRSVLKEKGQRPKAVSKPFSRPLAPEDVLSFAVGEDAVTLVTADGKKHTVEL